MASGSSSAVAAGGERLRGRDWRLIAVAVLVAVVSLLVVNRYFYRAFPEASIDFQVSGSSSEPIAAQFLQARGLSLAGYQHASQFDYDDEAKTFLERQLGPAPSSALMSRTLHLWRWDHRWFKPLTQEEFDVEVATSGQVVGFDHVIPADAPGASPTEAQARATAQQFLGQVMHLDWQAWVLVGAARQVRAHRVDYVFTWKDAAPLMPGATGYLAQAEHRHVVQVQGGVVGSYSDFLKVPDQWARGYDKLRSRNDTTGLVDTGLLIVLFVALLFVLVMRVRRGDVRWRLALWVGGAGAVLSFLASLNEFGADRFAYHTTQSWPAFIAYLLANDVASAVGVGVFFVALTAAAESLYRERFGGHMAVESFLSWRGLRSRSFFISMVLGLALAAFFFAYQTIFYLIANHFGAWAPADVPYDQLLNTRLPWAYVLFSGFFPAISEEFGFRMFAIPLLEKWFRYLWVAVIAASFIWGFGHATYPNQPFYIRGIEVGLGGLLLSWIMIRYGILATVVWHYTVDALYTAMLLLRAHDTYLRWSGAGSAFIAVLPLLIAIGAYWRCGGFAPETGETNAELPAPPPVPEAEPEPAAVLPAYDSIPGGNWTMGLIVGGVLLSAFAVPVVHWRTALPWRLDESEAVSAARQFLQRQGFNAAGFRAAAVPESVTASGHGEENQIAATDILHRVGSPALLGAFSGSDIVADYWHIRFFRALDPEEFNVAVRPDNGRIIGFDHQLPETAAGASPTLAAAQTTAQQFLAANGIDVTGIELRTAQQTHRPARIDSTFVWDANGAGSAAASSFPNPLPGEVSYRVEADVDGARPAYFASWYHVPQARVRAWEQSTLGSIALSLLRGLMYAALAMLVGILLFRFARHATVPWGTLIKVALVAGVLMLAIAANALPATLMSYPTDTPFSAYLTSAVMGVLVDGLGGFLFTLALLAAVAMTAPEAGALTAVNARRQLERTSAWDALWVGLLSLAWVAGWRQVQTVINSRWHAAGQLALPMPPAGLTSVIPGLSDVLAAPLHALWIAAGLGILLPVLASAWRQPARRWWCVAGIALLWIGMFPHVHSGVEFARAAIFSGMTLVLLLSFARMFLRTSPLAYLSAALVPALALPGIEWLNVSVGWAHVVGAVLLALAAGWLLWLARVAHPGAAEQTDAKIGVPAV